MPLHGSLQAPRLRVPGADAAVPGTGRHEGAIRRKEGEEHRAAVARQAPQAVARLRLPDARRAVQGGGERQAAVAREAGGLHRVLVPAELAHAHARERLGALESSHLDIFRLTAKGAGSETSSWQVEHLAPSAALPTSSPSDPSKTHPRRP